MLLSRCKAAVLLVLTFAIRDNARCTKRSCTVDCQGIYSAPVSTFSKGEMYKVAENVAAIQRVQPDIHTLASANT